MYPGMMYWWKTHRHGGGCHAAHYAEGEHRHGGHRHRAWREYESSPHGGDLGSGAFGVRRDPETVLERTLDDIPRHLRPQPLLNGVTSGFVPE